MWSSKMGKLTIVKNKITPKMKSWGKSLVTGQSCMSKTRIWLQTISFKRFFRNYLNYSSARQRVSLMYVLESNVLVMVRWTRSKIHYYLTQRYQTLTTHYTDCLFVIRYFNRHFLKYFETANIMFKLVLCLKHSNTRK